MNTDFTKLPDMSKLESELCDVYGKFFSTILKESTPEHVKELAQEYSDRAKNTLTLALWAGVIK